VSTADGMTTPERLPRRGRDAPDRDGLFLTLSRRVSVAWRWSMMTFWDGVALVLTFHCVRRSLTEQSSLS
jgi:hypothetical protein